LQDLHYQLNYNFNGGETRTQRPKAMVIINPNNPTGRLLTKEQMEEIVIFCVENRLVLIACEVLQDLAYIGDFISFRSVINSMPAPFNKLELFSTHSASKSNLFNSGARAGYLNTLNITPEIKNQLYKHISMDICSGLPGQIMMDLTLTPPSMEEGIFTPEFIQRYNASIRLSKHIHREIVLDVRDALASTKLFTFIAPKAGFTFFLNFNVNYICDHSANRKVLMRSEPLCDIYTNQLFKEKQILVTPGNGNSSFFI
jgi:aspartate/methionine/tyrosine aminotransferase